MPEDEEQRKIQASNRRTLVVIGLIIALFAGPAVFELGRYLIESL